MEHVPAVALRPCVPLDSNDSSNELSSVTTAPWSLYSPARRMGFLLILFLVTTSNYFDYYILSVVLEPIKHEFHASDTLLGLLSGFCFALVYAFAALPIARWSDRGDRRTVITVALSLWSVITSLCGMAQSFFQLALSRFALGAIEPGGMPPAQSLIVDYFPANRRAMASSVLNAGSAAGYFAGVGIGGYIAATHGWRVAFLVAGVPGLLLALIAYFGLAEPREKLGFPSDNAGREGMWQAFSQLRRKRTFVFMLAALSTYTVFSYGIAIFLPSFLIRVMHSTLTQVSLSWGFTVSAADLTGAMLGGWLGDRLTRRDVRWCAWLPATTCLVGGAVYILTLVTHDLFTFIAFNFVAETILTIGISITYVPVHAVCGSPRRTVAIAMTEACTMLVGAGLGPFLAGGFSDLLNPTFGLESIRYSLLAMLTFLIPASIAFYLAARAMPRELEA